MKEILLSSLKTNAKNPRTITKDKLEKLKKSIESFKKMMELRPIIVDEGMNVLGGNMRLQALKDLNYRKIPESWVKISEGLTAEEKREFIIKDNIGFGDWDWDSLANEWDQDLLAEWGMELDFASRPDALPKYEGDDSGLEYNRLIIVYKKEDKPELEKLVGLEIGDKILVNFSELKKETT